MTAAETPKKAKRQITESRVQLTEYVHNVWSVVPEYGTTLEDMLVESYWAMPSMKFKPMDIIQVMSEDGAWWAQLLVRHARQGAVKVGLLVHKEFSGEAVEAVDVDDYTITWRGPHRKFAVQRKGEDGAVMKEGFPDKTEAMSWLVHHQRAVAA